jgi:hypothetical protein
MYVQHSTIQFDNIGYFYTMAKVKRLQLDDEVETDFVLFALVFHGKDYKLCYEINKAAGIDLSKAEDLEAIASRSGERGKFSFYTFESEEDAKSWHVISNRGLPKGTLIPEQKQIDFFLILKGTFRQEEKKEFFLRLKNIPKMIGVYELDPAKLKSKGNLVF